MMNTKDGDYIQQWGIAGSDLRAPTKKERRANDELDHLLGLGDNLTYWLSCAKYRMRVQNSGKTLLVNYPDKGFMNAILSLMGHGYYTRYKAILFNARMIAKEFYMKPIEQ